MECTWQQDLMAAQALRSEACVQVRRRIFRQLAESVIYEGIVTPLMEAEGEKILYSLQGQDAAGRKVIYRCLGQRRFTFGRIRMLTESPLIRLGGGVEAEASSLRLFVEEVLDVPGVDRSKLISFAEELEQTLLKDAIAQFHRNSEGRELRRLSGDDLESAVMDGIGIIRAISRGSALIMPTILLTAPSLPGM